MRRFLRSRKGASLAEVMIAMVILAIATVPIAATFMNAMFTSKLSKEQMETSAVIRIVKENVADAVKNDATVCGNSDKPKIQTDSHTTSYGLLVFDHNDGNSYPDYQYNVTYVEPLVPPDTYGCKKFDIVLEKKVDLSFKPLREFNIEVNALSNGSELD